MTMKWRSILVMLLAMSSAVATGDPQAPDQPLLLALNISQSASTTTSSSSSPAPISNGTQQPFCLIENSFQFVGNDIGTRVAPQAQDCCGICARTANCKAFSWSSDKGGTCWLKSGRGRIVVDANYKSALVFPVGYEPTIPEFAAVNSIGNDLSSTAPVPSSSGCIPLCRATLGCRAFAWTLHNAGTCWFKSQMGPTVVKYDVTSGQVYPDPIYPASAQEPSTDFVGNDIGTGPSRNPQGCQRVCLRTAGCRAYSWTNYNGGTCWLKNLKGATVANDNVVSVQVFGNPPPPSCTLEVDVDYVDNDIGSAPSDDPYKCCSICMKTNGCGAFSWSDYNGGTCWLKSKRESLVHKDGVQSAVV